MKYFLAAILGTFLVVHPASYAQQAPEPLPAGPASTFGAALEIPLYPGLAPGSEKWNYSEYTVHGPKGVRAINVVRPVLLYFPAPRTKFINTAMIVCPGGGERMLMMSYEGTEIAKALNDFGVDAFILKYRLSHVENPDQVLPPGPATTGPQAGQNLRELAADDGRQAVGVIRTRAKLFGFAPNRIGMIGFSAGGTPIHGALYGPAETQPNFAALIYAISSHAGDPITVPPGAPPLFLAVAADDSAANSQGAIEAFTAWHQAKVPVELHVFQMGAHGFFNKGGGADHFMDRVKEWMQVNGFLTQEH